MQKGLGKMELMLRTVTRLPKKYWVGSLTSSNRLMPNGIGSMNRSYVSYLLVFQFFHAQYCLWLIVKLPLRVCSHSGIPN